MWTDRQRELAAARRYAATGYTDQQRAAVRRRRAAAGLSKPATFTRGLAPAAVLNRQQSIREIQENIIADNRPIPVVYGHAQVGGQIFALDYSSDTFTIGYLICQGEIGSFQNIWFDGKAAPAGVTVTEYTGTSGQTADATLAAAIDGYADDLANLAYIVVQFAGGVFDTFPRVVAEIQGKQVYDPRGGGSTAYSANPALHLGDLLASSDYGLGMTVDATALGNAADACDDTTGISEARRESFLVMDTVQRTEEWVETLRTYAGCFVVYRGQTAYLVEDRPAASVATFTASDIVDGSLTIRKKDSADLPTVVQVLYTDTSGNEWRERASNEATTGGARRVSKIRLPGITRHSQAYREAVERLNKLTLSDLEVEFSVFDEGLELEAGDVITVSHPYGLTSKTLRIVQPPVMESHGRWRIVGEEYDAAAYSNTAITQPSTPDTTLPVSEPPAAVAGLTVSETTYTLQNGKYASRLNISWTASANQFVTGYAVKVYAGATVIWATTISDTSVSTSPLKELIEYTVEVKALTALYVGDGATSNYTIIGKTAVPTAPASVSGFEAGGEVRLNWPKSTDVDAERYRVKYGATGGSYATATDLDIVDGLRLVTKDVPEGTWRFYVATIDSIGQESTSQATIDLAVTLDNDAYTADSLASLGGTIGDMTNMHESVESRTAGGSAFYSSSGESWNTLFGASAMSTFTAELASYQTLGSEAVYLSDEIDLVADNSGNFQATISLEDFGNTITQELGVKPDGGAYTYTAQLSQQATGRYTRVKVRASSPFMVRGSGGSLRVDVVAREEVGEGTSSATLATTVTLDRQYAAVRSVTITPIFSGSAAARSPVVDNITLDNGAGATEFDVYIFDSGGSQVAQNFRYVWKGV